MILGAILAGGRSTRFGSDKAEAMWRGRPLLDHVADRLSSVCAKVIVCGRSSVAFEAIADRPTSDLGPLGGLNAALHFALADGFSQVLSAPCDAPSLSNLVLAELSRIPGNAYLAEMPVIGCWRADTAPLLDQHLRGGQGRSMRSWAERVDAAMLKLPAPLNINRPADLEALDGAR